MKRFFQQLWRNVPKPSAWRRPTLRLPPSLSAVSTTRAVSTDTLVLVAALIFLSFAIILAVLFPPMSRQQPGVAEVGTTAPTAAAPAASTAIAVPQSTAASDASVPTGAPVVSYPEPALDQATAGVVATSDPLRPTAAPGTEGAPAGGLASQPTGYPAPGAQGGVIASGPTAAAQAPTAAAPEATASPTAIAEATTAPTQPPLGATQPPLVAQTPQVGNEATPVPQAAPTASLQASSSGPPPTRRPTQPPAPPVDVIRGTTYWTAARSPIVVGRDVRVPPGAALIVEPGTEVRLGPGVSIFVDGQLLALGQPGNLVRFVAADRPRWEGIFGRTGSSVVLENTELSGGGAGGTTIAVEGGTLALRGARIRDNGGHIRTSGGSVEVRDSEIAGNDMPYGAALDVTFTAGGTATLLGNRIGGNRLATGAPPVQITSQSPFDTISVDIQRNLLVGQDGPDLTFVTNGQIQGGVVCNALVGGANGLSVRGGITQVPGLPLLRVRENAIEKHTPPILPVYLEFGIGRGATSIAALDMRENWWESDTGPYEPDRYADGRGDAVGENIEFIPWLKARPACAPVQ